MKNRTAIILALLLSVTIIASAQGVREEYQQDFKIGSNGVLIVNSLIGDVEIFSWDKDYISIEAVKMAHGQSADEILKAIQYEVDRHGNRLIFNVEFPKKKIKGLQKQGKGINVSVNLKIFVPEDCSIGDLNIAMGNAELKNINGKINVAVSRGNIEGKNLAGDITMVVAMGTIELKGAHGEMELTATIGEIDLDGITGEVKATCTSGEITIDAVDLEGLWAQNTSGDIVVALESPLTYGDIHLKSMSGDIELTLPGASAFSLIAQAKGEVISDFPLKKISKNGMKKYSAEVNEGGGSIQLITFSGDIVIEK
jgi:DUF4097 and DUF4098 domain-containing protein YvlB